MGQAVEDPRHGVELGLHLRATAQIGKLGLPDLAHLKLFPQQQHRQLCRLAQGHFLEFAQRMIRRDHQLQFVFVKHHGVQPRLAWRQVTDANVE